MLIDEALDLLAQPPKVIPPGAYYDPTLPVRFQQFCYKNFLWPEGFTAGQPVVWARWQIEEIIQPCLGWRWSASGHRVVKTCYLISAKGCGKTCFAAALGLFGLFGFSRRRNPTPKLTCTRCRVSRLIACTAPQSGCCGPAGCMMSGVGIRTVGGSRRCTPPR